MNFRAFQYRELYLSRGGPGVLEMQKSCVIGNAKLFALLEDLIPHLQETEEKHWDHLRELVIKSGGQQEPLTPKWAEEMAATHSMPGNGLDSGYPSL